MAVQISGNDITVPRDGSFTRNVTIGGTLTYEDVTNIDSVGLVTARTGIEIGARPGVAASISVDGNMVISGIMTAQKSGVFGNTSDSFTALTITSSTSGISELRFADTTANAGYVKYQNSDNALILATNTSERLRIDSSGRLLIGHTSSQQSTSMLQVSRANNSTIRVANSDATATNYAAVDFAPANSIAGARIAAVADGTFSSTGAETAYLKFDTRNAGTTSEKARITASGDFGIGTNSPDRKLDVSGTGNVYGKFQSTNTTGAGIEVKDSGQDWLIQADNGGSQSSLAFYDLANTAYRVHMKDNGNLEIVNGDLKVASGHGIDFSATADGTGTGSTSEVLDDYEEGTWSPQIGGSTTAGSYNKTGEGFYIKVGRQVTVWLNCTGSVSGASGTTRITGLPFTAAANQASNGYTAVYSAGSAQYWSGFGSADILGALIVVGTTYIYFHTDNGSSTGANQAIQNGGHNAHVHASYFTN